MSEPHVRAGPSTTLGMTADHARASVTGFPNVLERRRDEKKIEHQHFTIIVDLRHEEPNGLVNRVLRFGPDQQIDINGGSRKPVHADRQSAAQRVLDATLVQRVANRIELPFEVEHVYAPSISRNAPLARSSASFKRSASLPPACARSGLPPPLPPTIGASCAMSLFAGTRSTRSCVTAVSNVTLPSAVVPRTTTPLLSLERNVSARLRRSPPLMSSTRLASSFTPATSTAVSSTGEAPVATPPPEASFIFSCLISFSSDFCFSINCACVSCAFASTWRKCDSAPRPVSASMRRTRAARERSLTILNTPMSRVRLTWQPPQNSREYSSAETTRTCSPYFSPNIDTAPVRFASAIGMTCFVTSRFSRMRVLTSSSIARSCSSLSG